MLQRQCYVDDAHYDMPLIFYIHGRVLHFGRREFSLISGLRFGEVSFSCYSEGELKFLSRIFPHRVGLKITSLDLIGVLEDEEFFSNICDKDAVHVCLLLSLEVIFMGHKLVHEFDDTLMRLVENLEAWNAFPLGESLSIKQLPFLAELAPGLIKGLWVGYWALALDLGEEFLLLEREYCIWKMELLGESAV
ncbi:phospholipase-like protein [Tanacetum coccineum]